jgi:hypothetical protein
MTQRHNADSADEFASTAALRALLREAASRLELDPASVNSPTPNAITAMAPDGTLLRLDVSRYRATEVSL